LFFHISFSSKPLSREWNRLMMEEKGKNGKFWYKSHKVDANSWGKEGM
jgi:hypothetical protein